jgi:hypothetical protein
MTSIAAARQIARLFLATDDPEKIIALFVELTRECALDPELLETTNLALKRIGLELVRVPLGDDNG